jgi:hypothetical protein
LTRNFPLIYLYPASIRPPSSEGKHEKKFLQAPNEGLPRLGYPFGGFFCALPNADSLGYHAASTPKFFLKDARLMSYPISSSPSARDEKGSGAA